MVEVWERVSQGMRELLRRVADVNVRRVAIIGAVLALLVQPGYIILSAQPVQALSENITQVAFTNSAQTVEVDGVASLSTQLRNADDLPELLNQGGAQLQLSSSSATGEFADGGSSTTWAASPSYAYASGSANKNFRYKDTTPGTYTITAKVSGGGIPAEVTATTEVVVASAPVVSLALAQRIVAAQPGDVIDITSDEVVTGNIIINKALTLTSSNGSTISTNGSGNLFRITAPGVTVSNLNFVKTDSINQNIISVGAANTTISGNTFTGQYNLGDDEVTRALELSTATGYVISGNTFTHLRQPAYINDFSAGEITGNYVSDTRGWVVVANTNLTFTGNTFGNNAVDIAFIPGQPNTYTCEVMQQIKQNNNNASIDNQVLNIASCDTTAPSIPTGGAPHDGYRATNEFDFTWNESTDDWPGDITYEFRSSRDHSQVGDAPDDSGAWMSGELSSPRIHSSGAANGKLYWQVRAIDAVGNKSDWSSVWHVTIDTVAPTLTILAPNEGAVFGNDDQIIVTSYMEDAWGLGQYFIDINGVASTDMTVQSPEVTTQNTGASLTVTALFTAADFADGDYVVTVRVSDKAGNVTEKNQTITIQHSVLPTPGLGGGSTPTTNENEENRQESDDALARLSQRLTQPFSVPRDFASSVGGTQQNEEVLGESDNRDVAGGEKTVAAVPSSEGWKIFGIAWYWWLLLAGVLGTATAWIVRRVRPAGE